MTLPVLTRLEARSGGMCCRSFLLLLLLLLLRGADAALGQSFLRASGPKIVNAQNQEVILNGVNLGGWALQEGYLMKPGWPGLNGRQTQGTVKQVLYRAGMSDAAVEAFYQSYRDNFITKPDIDYIASLGFNCVRLPMHYDLFLTPTQRAVRDGVLRGTVSYETYVSSLTTWYNAGELFTEPAQLEGVRMIDQLLDWCAANKLYVVLDLHAAPGAQGTDPNIVDVLTPLDFWTRPVYQDITVRLWATLAARYRQDARVAMYDLLNEPNNVPSNRQMHDVYQRLISAVRAQGDQHLLLLEGNQFGNNYDYMEPFTFSHKANLVSSSHRYTAPAYPLDNALASAEARNPNQLRTIGNLTRFRATHNVPVWVGETGENTAAWMSEAARSLNSVRIGWCHWTYKRFDAYANPALLRIRPPYVVDGPAGLAQVLHNIRFASCVPNPETRSAVAPPAYGLLSYPDGGSYLGTPVPTAAPLGAVVWLQGNNGRYVSSEGGHQAMTCTRAAYGAQELFVVEDAGGGQVRLRGAGGYVSAGSGEGPLTCRPAADPTTAFHWVLLPEGTVALRSTEGRFVSSEDGQQPLTCNRPLNNGWERFRFGVVTEASLAARPAASTYLSAYPNPVRTQLHYELPAGVRAHTLRMYDAVGRPVLTRPVDAAAAPVLDVSALPAGLYYLQLTAPGMSRRFHITKQ